MMATACAAGTEPGAAAADGRGETSSAVDGTPASAPPPVMLVDGFHVEGNAGLWVVGSVDDTRVPVTFTLREEMGCARDVKLRASTVGKAFSFEVGEAELTDAFACAVRAEAGDVALPLITLTPGAEASGSADLSLDAAFAVAARSLEPADGYVVRFTVRSTSAIDEARVTLAGTSYLAAVSPADEGSEVPNAAVFDVPAQAWAAAVVTQASVEVDVKRVGGAYRALTLRPNARVDAVDEDCH